MFWWSFSWCSISCITWENHTYDLSFGRMVGSFVILRHMLSMCMCSTCSPAVRDCPSLINLFDENVDPFERMLHRHDICLSMFWSISCPDAWNWSTTEQQKVGHRMANSSRDLLQVMKGQVTIKDRWQNHAEPNHDDAYYWHPSTRIHTCDHLQNHCMLWHDPDVPLTSFISPPFVTHEWKQMQSSTLSLVPRPVPMLSLTSHG